MGKTVRTHCRVNYFIFESMPVQEKKPIYYYLSCCLTALLCIALLTPGCRNPKPGTGPERAFYYWKSALKLSPYEKAQLDRLKVRTIYIKLFDVVWNADNQTAGTAAKLTADSASLGALQQAGSAINIVPVIFITNESLQQTDTAAIDVLAGRISSLATMIAGTYHITFSELQFDCDWTAGTREKYFALLHRLRTAWSQDAVKFSATIRLHQVKFITKSGIPPVDKGLLMCYNMGNLRDPAAGNSILDVTELKKYISGISTYSLPLDIALPLFDWKVLYRNGQYAGLLQDLPGNMLTDAFTAHSGNRYQVLKDTLLLGYSLKKGDLIRDEQSDIKELIKAGETIAKQLKNTPNRVALYHLDAVLLSKYSTHELESIYNSLR